MAQNCRTADQLETAKNFLMTAIQQVPAGVLVASAPDVNIIVANDFALGIRGADRASRVELPADNHPQNWQVFHLDGTPFSPTDLPLSRAVLNGETCKDVDVIILDEDGVDRWVLATAAPVRDSEGQVIGGVVVFPNISDRRAAEREQEQLRQQRHHTQKLESLGVLAGGVSRTTSTTY